MGLLYILVMSMKKHLIDYKAIKKQLLLSWYESKRLLGHPLRLVFLLLLFFVFVMTAKTLLGNAQSLPTVVIVDEDRSIEVRTFVENVAYNKLKNVVDFKEMPLEEGLELLDAGQVIGVIQIPEGTRDNLDTLTPSEMRLYIKDHEDIRVQLLKGYMEDMVRLLNEGQSGAMVYWQEMKRQGLSYDQRIGQLEDISFDYGLAFITRGDVFATSDIKDPLEGILPIQYYGYGLLWLVVLVSSAFAHSTLIGDGRRGMQRRLYACGYSKGNYFLSRIINGTVFSLFWMGVMILLYRSILGIDLIPFSPIRWLLILWIIGLLNGFVVVLLLYYRERRVLVGVIGFFCVLLYTSGLLVPDFYMGKLFQQIGEINLINFGDNLFKEYPLNTWRSLLPGVYTIFLYWIHRQLSNKVVD